MIQNFSFMLNREHYLQKIMKFIEIDKYEKFPIILVNRPLIFVGIVLMVAILATGSFSTTADASKVRDSASKISFGCKFNLDDLVCIANSRHGIEFIKIDKVGEGLEFENDYECPKSVKLRISPYSEDNHPHDHEFTIGNCKGGSSEFLLPNGSDSPQPS